LSKAAEKHIAVNAKVSAVKETFQKGENSESRRQPSRILVSWGSKWTPGLPMKTVGTKSGGIEGRIFWFAGVQVNTISTS